MTCVKFEDTQSMGEISHKNPIWGKLCAGLPLYGLWNIYCFRALSSHNLLQFSITIALWCELQQEVLRRHDLTFSVNC